MNDIEKSFYKINRSLYNGKVEKDALNLVINNEEHRDRIKKALQEMSGACTRIEAEKDFIKDVLIRLKDEVGIEPKYGRKLLKIYHNQNLQEQIEEAEEIEQLYTSVFDN